MKYGLNQSEVAKRNKFKREELVKAHMTFHNLNKKYGVKLPAKPKRMKNKAIGSVFNTL